MRIARNIAIYGLSILLSSGCAWQGETATERDFGNSVRTMVAEQTANPEPRPVSTQTSDGQRLEQVIEDYRKTVGERRRLDKSTRIGLSNQGEQQ